MASEGSVRFVFARAMAAGVVLFANDVRFSRRGVVEVLLPRTSIEKIAREKLLLGSRESEQDGRGYAAVRFDAPALRLISAPNGRVFSGIPPRFTIAERGEVVAFLTGALLSSPLRPGIREWRIYCPSLERSLGLVALLRRVNIDASVRKCRVAYFVSISEQDGSGLSELTLDIPTPRSRRARPAAGSESLDEFNFRRRDEQRERTLRALSELGDNCPPTLRVAGELRLRFPDSSLEEIGKLCDPPQSRHALNGRLRRLHALAQEHEND